MNIERKSQGFILELSQEELDAIGLALDIVAERDYTTLRSFAQEDFLFSRERLIISQLSKSLY